MAKKKIVYPDDLESILDAKITDCTGYTNSKLSKEREAALLYYNQDLPKRANRGSSGFVVPIVYNSVNAMRAQLLEAYANGTEIVAFTSTNANDVEASRIATAYAQWVLFKANNGFGILGDAIHDGLMARCGVVKVWWEASSIDSDESFEGLDDIALAGLGAQPDVSNLDPVHDLDDGSFSGTLTRSKDTSQVRIENVAPESFFVEPQAAKLEGSFHFERFMKTKAEIKAMGFDTKLLKDTSPDADETSLTDVESDARNSRTDIGYSHNRNNFREIDQKYWVYECYIHLTSPDNRPALYKVVRVADVILAYEEIDRSPFKIFVPLRQSHMLEGENFAALTIPTQAATTMITRAILDHAAMTANPRYLVQQGGLPSPRELLENRVGGIINVKDVNASIAPMPQPMLNPALMGMLAMFKQQVEETTGMSSLSQGLNKDALSQQNSQGLVNDLVDNSMTRTKVIARNFAYNFLQPLFIEIYQLILENDTGRQQTEIEIAGNFVKIDPTTWIARKDCSVTMHLSQSDKTNEGTRLSSMLALGAQDPVINSFITPQNRYNIAAKVFTLNGFQDINSFITPPSQIPPPKPAGPDPMVQASMALQQRQVAVQESAAQTEALKASNDFELKKAQLQLAVSVAEVSRLTKEAETHRKAMVSAANIDAEQREIALLEAAPPAVNLSAVDNPKPST